MTLACRVITFRQNNRARLVVVSTPACSLTTPLFLGSVRIASLFLLGEVAWVTSKFRAEICPLCHIDMEAGQLQHLSLHSPPGRPIPRVRPSFLKVYKITYQDREDPHPHIVPSGRCCGKDQTSPPPAIPDSSIRPSLYSFPSVLCHRWPTCLRRPR